MKLDTQNAPGTFKINTLDGQEQDAEVKDLRNVLTVAFHAPPEFLDLYLDGHNSGAQPSMVFWRTYEETKGQFVRYQMVDKLMLVVVEKARYHLKITTPRPKDRDDDNYMGYREYLVGDVELKAAEVEFMANACIAKLKVETHPEREQMKDLIDLALVDAVSVSIWSAQGDLFDKPNPAANGEPRANDTQTDLEDGPKEPADETSSIE